MNNHKYGNLISQSEDNKHNSFITVYCHRFTTWKKHIQSQGKKHNSHKERVEKNMWIDKGLPSNLSPDTNIENGKSWVNHPYGQTRETDRDVWVYF